MIIAFTKKCVSSGAYRKIWAAKDFFGDLFCSVVWFAFANLWRVGIWYEIVLRYWSSCNKSGCIWNKRDFINIMKSKRLRSVDLTGHSPDLFLTNTILFVSFQTSLWSGKWEIGWTNSGPSWPKPHGKRFHRK